jgi:hypothetical protein
VLDGGRDHPLSLLSAPAGFGKTTTLTEWVEQPAGKRLAWVSLDPGDREPVRLWTHVIAALSRSGAGVGSRSMAALRARSGQVVESESGLRRSPRRSPRGSPRRWSWPTESTGGRTADADAGAARPGRARGTTERKQT